MFQVNYEIFSCLSTYPIAECQSNCQHCKETFQYPRALSAHTTYGCGELGSSASSRETTTDKAGDDSDGEVRFATKNSSDQPKGTENEYEEQRIRLEDSATEEDHLNDGKTDRYSPDDTTGPMINEQYSATFGHSRVLSNPKLACLISSFSRPSRFRKFANESQSLAEYHKQEFRKKFQGNEHFLRRHLYRENMEKRSRSIKYRRALAMKEDSGYSLEGDEDELLIKEEKDEFINCFGEDYMLDQHNSSTFLPSSPESEIFRNENRKSTSRFNFPGEHLPLNDSFTSHSNITGSAGSKMTLITRGCPTSNGHESPRGNEEHLSREAARECTCQHHDGTRDSPKQCESSTVDQEEMNVTEETATEENEENRATLREELDRSICSSNQLNPLGSAANLTRFAGSYFVYHRSQREEDMSFRQHFQCNCYSCTSLHELTDNAAATRYHEPAFFVDPMYRYSTYPRMIPFFAHHAVNSPQASPRNQGFTCEYCGKVYCRKYVLKIHMRTHTGFKPLQCKVCDKSFSDPSNMKKHVKLHETEDTVHKCRHCGRNFVRYRGLLNHIKSKHSEFVSL